MPFLKVFLGLIPSCVFVALGYADTQITLAKQLGWISDPNKSTCSVCGGYYDLNQFPAGSPLSFKESGSVVKLNPPFRYQVNGDMVFNNGMLINQPGRTLLADSGTLTPNLDTGKLEALSAKGNIRIAEPNALLLADSMQANLVNHKASIIDVTYLLRVGETKPTLVKTQAIDSDFTGFAHGSATQAEQTAENQYFLTHATYSTCSPYDATWQLQATSIHINQAKGEGTARNTILKIHGIPVFYLPYFSFPTTDQRKSGFLYGNISSNSNGGLTLSLPYYFNLAPNYDDTLTPTIYSKRGILFDNNFRYLTAKHSGNIDLQVIPLDQKSNQDLRYSYTINDSSNFNKNWSGQINYSTVSDDEFLQDFSLFQTNQVLLNRSASVNYQNLHWNFSGTMQNYQILNPELTTANRPYNLYPSLNLSSQYPAFFGPLSFSFNSNFSNFNKSAATSFEAPPVEGSRLYLMPTLSMSLSQTFGYLTPTISDYNTHYVLSNAAVNNFSGNQPNINVPIMSVDSGLYFDRNFNWGGKSYTQTLSPRLFYLYVPYRDQNEIPIFDTTIIPFSYSQLFSTNSFSGYDRISNANQLAYALSTTINNSAGNQIMSLGAGQILYFQNREVSLCTTTPGAPACIQTENPDYNRRLSDLAGYFTYNFNPQWALTTNLTYNQQKTYFDSQAYTLTYTPNSMDVFNLGYQNNRYDYSLLSTEQLLAGTSPPASSIINTSFVWGLTPKWATFGSLNYSIQNHGPIAEFAGIQYSSCCWAIRFGDYRYVTNTNPNTPNVLTGPMSNAVLLQFLLKGLGNTNSGQSSDNLLNTIPTYHGQLGF